MGAPKPVEKRVWPNGIPVNLGMIHDASCDRLKFTAESCDCGHVHRVITHGKTPERIAEIRVHVPTYPKENS